MKGVVDDSQFIISEFNSHSVGPRALRIVREKAKPRAQLPLGVSTSACQAQYDYQEARIRSRGYL